jgi:hypothetical protein
LYAGQITAEPGKQKQIISRLRQGWNTLVFKANQTGVPSSYFRGSG